MLMHSNSLLYADDTTIFTSHKSATEIKQRLNSDLVNIYRWCTTNPTKTTLIFSSPENHTSRAFSTLDNHVISLSDTTKFLGASDKNLKLNFHVQSLLKK